MRPAYSIPSKYDAGRGRNDMSKKCSVEGCERKHNSHGYCSMHLHRLKRYGDPLKYKHQKTGLMSNNKNEYYTYRHILQRCYDVNCEDYKNYGGRGIKVCDRWLGPDGFEFFLHDMGRKPDKNYSIDRIDVNEGYCPDNCRWADEWTQASNKRRNKPYITGVHKNNRGSYTATIKAGEIRKSKRFKKLEDATQQRLSWEEEFGIKRL